MFPADSLAGAAGNSTVFTAIIAAVGSSIVVPIVGLLANRRHGKRKDEERRSSEEERHGRLEKLITRNHLETTQQFTAVSKDLLELRAYVIGPDGENGIRGDVRELKGKVEGLVERERDRLEAKVYDRRRSGS